MAIPDGGPLSTVGQKRGHKNMERTTGPSLMGGIFEISAKKGYRHYFMAAKKKRWSCCIKNSQAIIGNSNCPQLFHPILESLEFG